MDFDCLQIHEMVRQIATEIAWLHEHITTGNTVSVLMIPHDMVNSQMAWKIAPAFQPEIYWLGCHFEFSTVSCPTCSVSISNWAVLRDEQIEQRMSLSPIKWQASEQYSEGWAPTNFIFDFLNWSFWFWWLVVGRIWPLKLRQGQNLVGVAYCPPGGGEIPVPRTRIIHRIVALSSLTGSKTTKKARANGDGWGWSSRFSSRFRMIFSRFEILLFPRFLKGG